MHLSASQGKTYGFFRKESGGFIRNLTFLDMLSLSLKPLLPLLQKLLLKLLGPTPVAFDSCGTGVARIQQL